MIVNCRDGLNRVQSLMKARQDNDVIDHTSTVYLENDTELL